MSFRAPKTIIEEKDTVILYLSASNKHAIDVTKEIKNKNGELVEFVFQTTFGALKVGSLIGKEYGSKVSAVRRPISVKLAHSTDYRRSIYRKDGLTSCNRLRNCGA